MAFRSYLLGVLGLFVTLARPVLAQVVDTTLTVGEGWAVVHELRRVALTAGEQEVVFEGIPLEADLSTLTVRTRRIPVDLWSWERMRWLATKPLHKADQLVLNRTGGIRDSSEQGPPPDVLSTAVRCRLSIPVGGTQVLALTYKLTGLSWAARYQVLIRGEPDGLDENVSVDVTGWVRLKNTTAHSFANAYVRLVGSDPRLSRPPARAPGFLMLEEGPLAELWEPEAPEDPPEQGYRLPRRATLPGRGETDVPFVQTHRVPSQRLYVLDADEIPLSPTAIMRPLHKYLVFRNSVAMGLGWILPPGPVEVFHGATRRTLLQTAFMPHTPINQEIRIDFGKATDVSARRRSMTRTSPEFGYYQETFEIRLQNDRPNEIMVEIIERPETTLSWTVIRATELFESQGSRLLMTTHAPGAAEKRIEYQLQFHQPTF